MSESLVPRQPALLESREESLTRQFYEWERRGRGWSVRPFPVELEPPFRPIILLDPDADNTVDDGRLPTFWSSLFEGTSRNQDAASYTGPTNEAYLKRIAELDEPSICDYYDQEFHELQIVLPKELKVTKSVSEQLLTSLRNCSAPISFEVIGTQKEVSIQMASTEMDLGQLDHQLKAYLPNSVIQRTNGYKLENTWETAGGYPLIVDFGLSDEFFIPLNVISSLDIDPLVSIIGAMSDLREEEVGLFQVLFQKSRHDWATEILDSVRFYDGTPFFSNAPEMIPFAKQKVNSSLFAVIVRIAAKGWEKERAWQIVRNIASGLSQLSDPTGNELIPLSNEGYELGYHEQALLRRQSFRCGMILNLEELVSLAHPPSASVKSEKLRRDYEKSKSAPLMALGNLFLLGENTHQGATKEITLTNDQRTRHVHLIGSSGSGKSTLLLNLIKQDLEKGQGLCVIDPHGDLIDRAIENVPENRLQDVILFDPSDSDHPVGLNILQANSELEKAILASDLIATFRRMSTSWGDVMDSVLANALLAFIESSRGGTLFELKRFLVEKDFRSEFLKSVTDETVRYFWLNEFPLITGKPQSSILIRLDAFLRQSLIRNIVCQKDNKLDFRHIMDSGKILLIKLSQGLIGEENAYLLGTMLVSRLYQAALSRQDSQDRPHFWLYLDEFHHFITPSMERILSASRKYNLGLILAHQEFRQLQTRSQEVASSVLSNCYTRICFRLGDTDAEKFAGGFTFFDAKALQNLGVGEAIARVERADYDFNMVVTPVPGVSKEIADKRFAAIVQHTRASYAKPRAEVEYDLSVMRENVAAYGVSAATALRSKTATGTGSEKPPGTRGNEPQTEHRYLQTLLKRIGEDNGFISTIEKEVFGGVGKIDVALENDFYRVACEIAITNTTDYEIQNIQKCLSSGFDRVAVISPKKAHLANIRKKAEAILTDDQISKLFFLEPESFHLFLESLSSSETVGISRASKIKGYKVVSTFKEISPADAALKKKVILDILSPAIRRETESPDE